MTGLRLFQVRQKMTTCLFLSTGSIVFPNHFHHILLVRATFQTKPMARTRKQSCTTWAQESVCHRMGEIGAGKFIVSID